MSKNILKTLFHFFGGFYKVVHRAIEGTSAVFSHSWGNSWTFGNGIIDKNTWTLIWWVIHPFSAKILLSLKPNFRSSFVSLRERERERERGVRKRGENKFRFRIELQIWLLASIFVFLRDRAVWGREGKRNSNFGLRNPGMKQSLSGKEIGKFFLDERA